MLQAKLTFNNQPLEDLIGYLQSYDKIYAEEFQKSFEEVKPPALDELHTTPGAVSYPIQWTSERQRKAYFATDGFGSGIPYQRTGALQEAWEFFYEGNGTRIVAVIRNRNPASPFVYGSLAKSNPGGFKQRFHTNTGWETMYDTVQFWLDTLREVFVSNMVARLGEYTGNTTTRQRAYTRTRR